MVITVIVLLSLFESHVDFVFHVAIYSSLSPSQGVTLNCVSTNDDIKTLEKANVIPSFSYSYHCLFHQTINKYREE